MTCEEYLDYWYNNYNEFDNLLISTYSYHTIEIYSSDRINPWGTLDLEQRHFYKFTSSYCDIPEEIMQFIKLMFFI